MQWFSSSLQDGLGKMLKIDNGHDRKQIELLAKDFLSKRYTIGDVLMPSVHNAMEIRSGRRLSDNQEVVIKLRYKPGSLFPDKEEREWRNATELMLNLPSNSGVAQILEVSEDDEKICIVTERAAGMDLYEALEANIQFSVPTVCEILAQLLEAVAHLHENGAIHRDLKLENVVMKPPCEANWESSIFTPWVPQSLKLIDFDTVQEWTPDTPPARLVQGTNQYIPQEGYGGRYSPLSDIFSAGVIAYRLVVGQFPFRDDLFDVDGEPICEPLVDNPMNRRMQYRLKVAKVPWDAPVLKQNPNLRDLLQKMMAPCEEQRPTAREALQHELFASRITIQSAQEESLPILRSSHIGLSKCRGHVGGVDMHLREMAVC